VVTLFVIEPNVHKISILTFAYILYLGYFLFFLTHHNDAGQSVRTLVFIDHDLSIEFHQVKDKVNGEVEAKETLIGTLSAGSRVGIMGFWLNIKSEVAGKQTTYNKFIFKDCLSSQDYARLSRMTRLVK